jgi:hypothetical protein
MTCGECPTCLERTRAALIRADVAARSTPLPAPTRAELLKHAEKFGPLLVNETAAEHGLDVKVKAETWVDKRRRRRRK